MHMTLLVIAALILFIVFCVTKCNTPATENYRRSLDTGTLDKYYFPYYYRYGGGLPTNLYSRQRLRSPGFFTTGWMWSLRPGVNRGKWAHNVWGRRTCGCGGGGCSKCGGSSNYYYINNCGSRGQVTI